MALDQQRHVTHDNPATRMAAPEGKMIPSKLKEPFWLVSVCIASLTLGLHLLSILTGVNPYVRDRLQDKGLLPLAGVCGILCVVLPIVQLWISIREERT
jgi:hypothetical protein